MGRELEYFQQVERSITRKYRKEIWSPFIQAIKRYELISEGDRIAVCISGGKDSMLMAVLIRMLQRISDVPFEAEYIVMDPGYNSENRRKIEENAGKLNIPAYFFESGIFSVAESADESPCYLCARMRRGALYSEARKRGCNKIALGHHFSDVIETTVMSMFYSGQLQGMMPKLHSVNFEGMELIRPLYCINENDIRAWVRYNDLEFIRCACKFTESRDAAPDGIGKSKRQEIKALIAELKKSNPYIEKNIFNSLHAVWIDTFPGYKTMEEGAHSFLEKY
ncbi:MAG: tRNA 2-thiocytidine biosynthesis protein TtcA [Lachnospiraceae bacterium]|nr:tRNA 2-thiocytidine biosynthesis protein TtcA [Lachnospiraceae bacterium]